MYCDVNEPRKFYFRSASGAGVNSTIPELDEESSFVEQHSEKSGELV